MFSSQFSLLDSLFLIGWNTLMYPILFYLNFVEKNPAEFKVNLRLEFKFVFSS